ncbi:MAG: lysylphosphatidylglycerol synthase domain-containing protein, partial [Desulfofustis sp.]
MLFKLLVSIGISVGLLGLLIHFTLSSTDPSVWSSLVAAVAAFPPLFLLLYFCTSLLRTLLQSLRYRLLIGASEPDVPSLYHMYLVVLSRNMFVDMLPARLGELSYIAMLNRGFRVSGESCVSSLTIAFVFDLIALGVLLGLLMLIQLVGGDFQAWMAGVLVMLVLLILFLLVLLFPAVAVANRIIGRISWLQRGLAGKAADLLVRIEQALNASRKAGITTRLLALSLGVRVFKYLGLYGLFVGVAAVQFPELSTRISLVLPALVSAEAGASLPVPAFMGFGTYEAGGMLALTALGASASLSLLVMLAMHVISQIVDYLLGGVGLILFI